MRSLIMHRTALVAFGGLVGSVARYWLAGAVQGVGGTSFPVGTFAVNVLGSFVVGFVMAESLDRGALGPNARLLLATGLCGGFTTMSTFSYETMALLRDGQVTFAAANVLATVVLCLGGAWIGQLVGRIV